MNQKFNVLKFVEVTKWPQNLIEIMPQAKKNSQTSAKNQVTAEAQSAEKSTPDNPNPEHFESTPEDEEEPSEVSDFKFKDFLLFCVKKKSFILLFFYVISKSKSSFSLSINGINNIGILESSL